MVSRLGLSAAQSGGRGAAALASGRSRPRGPWGARPQPHGKDLMGHSHPRGAKKHLAPTLCPGTLWDAEPPTHSQGPMGYKALTHHQGPYNRAPIPAAGTHSHFPETPGGTELLPRETRSTQSLPRALPQETATPGSRGHHAAACRWQGRHAALSPSLTRLAGLDADGLEAGSEDGGVGHVGVQAPLLAAVHQHAHQQQQHQAHGHGDQPHVQRHVLSALGGCAGQGVSTQGCSSVSPFPRPSARPPPRGTHRGCRARRCSCGSPARRRGTPGPRCAARAPSTRGSASACTRSRTPTTCSTPTRRRPLRAQRGSAPRRHPLPRTPSPALGPGRTDGHTHGGWEDETSGVGVTLGAAGRRRCRGHGGYLGRGWCRRFSARFGPHRKPPR